MKKMVEEVCGWVLQFEGDSSMVASPACYHPLCVHHLETAMQ